MEEEQPVEAMPLGDPVEVQPAAEVAPPGPAPPESKSEADMEAPVAPAAVAEEALAEAKAAKAPKQPQAVAAAPEGRARRERKTVEFYKVETKVEEEFVIKAGKGSKLRDIPNVAYKLSKLTGKDELLESLHLALFRRKGTANQRKKAILEFSGFAFDGDVEEKELESRTASFSKWKLELIHKLMDVLDLPRGSTDKAAKVERIVAFFKAPRQESNVDLASKEAAKKAQDKAKRERALAKKEKEKAKKREAKRKVADTKKSPAKKRAKKEKQYEGEEEEESEPEEEDMSSEPATSGEEAAAGSTGKDEAATAHKEEAAQDAPAADAGADPALGVSHETLKADITALLVKMTKEGVGVITAKTIMTALQEQYGFSVRARKSAIKQIAQEYADENLLAPA